MDGDRLAVGINHREGELAAGRGAARVQLIERQLGLPAAELQNNLGLYLKRQSLSRILFMHELYQKIVPVHGVIMDFGTRWGQNLALFSSFRGMYEPYNYNRKLVGFDTFSGFPSHAPQDGSDAAIQPGAYGVTPDYEQHLAQLLAAHEAESPLDHIVKHELVKGDVTETLLAFAIGIGAAVLWGTGIGAGLGAWAGHAAGGMNRGDLKDLGEMLDNGQYALVAVAAAAIADRVEAAVKHAEKVERKELKADSKAAKGQSVELALDTAKLHIFDADSGVNLTVPPAR